MSKKINFIHFDSLNSTNQKLYQLAETDVPTWTVVSTDQQLAGKGYANNVWRSAPYSNATFSFLVRYPLKVHQDLAYFNMWIATQITQYLSKWQFKAQVKWPNDILVNEKKIGGILIETKLAGETTKFCVVGIGINLNQIEFEGLPQASSLKLENPGFSLSPKEFIIGLVHQFQKNFDQMIANRFEEIDETYHQLLFRKDKVSVFKLQNELINGIIRRVNSEGNIVIELENKGEQVFRHKEISLLY